MNDWLVNSIIYAMDKNYLDMLYSIYPLINNEERIIHENLKQNIIKNFNDKNNQQLIQNLEPRERKIIIMRYYRDKTQSEIANELGVSQVQVSRLENKILDSMKSVFLNNDNV